MPGYFSKMINGVASLLTVSLAMFSFLSLSAEAGALVPAGTDGQAPVLMPVPSSIQLSQDKFRLDEKFYAGGQDQPGGRGFKAVARFMSRLGGRTGLFLEQDFLADQTPGPNTRLFYKYERVGRLLPNEDESYVLEIKTERIELRAPTDLGILRGLETLLQLLSSDDSGYYFPCGRIEDRPRFTWRGLLIDSCRHFMPLEVIKRNLLAMAAVKLNVLHWHLSEDQGFRVESRTFPRLHQMGSDGMYYTQEQVREIIGFAADLGIRVMPEFDIPGHSTSWFVGYPEYASAPGPYRIERGFGVFHPVFNPANPATYKFFDRFFREMASLFPDPYLHIGGDEVEAVHWKENPQIQAFMKKHNLADNHALQAYFNLQILKILTKYKKKMVGWDEIYQPGLPKDIVIQSWRGTQALVDGARKGYQGILSNGYYIDLCEPAERHYLNDPIPPDSPLSADEKKLILGGEATMWAELVSPETVDSRIWPRAAAIAERLWSPQEIRDVEDMYRRLRVISVQLEEHGVQHLRNQDMMLRRLVGTVQVSSPEMGALRALARICEPVKGYARHSQGRKYTSLAPLTRFVDSCFPESLEARDFRKRVEEYLSSRQSIKARALENDYFLPMTTIVAQTSGLSERIPALKEIKPLTEKLRELVFIGSDALFYLKSGKQPGAQWLEKQKKLLEELKKPQAECQLAIIPAVEKLLTALEEGKK
ncbi:MAG: N-acetyl-beta-hexosaminidase, GH20 family [Candidatus Saccharicenans subterraneus]|uniref:N-acetyl-beta-hexosaminidase, GH20 family n=1 Tax=Candidatus Saccharicenans subterraneus TaxID=2508984 RepID=A0A3E2BN33_9BACT|nr:MAG: N-acetyl-beta-hexosaminidase, GH20 family [Candidatus Saccharicenans subterraneum]